MLMRFNIQNSCKTDAYRNHSQYLACPGSLVVVNQSRTTGRNRSSRIPRSPCFAYVPLSNLILPKLIHSQVHCQGLSQLLIPRVLELGDFVVVFDQSE